MKYSIFKRLSNQAAASVTSGLRGCDWQLEYDKIFAELIVQECARVARATPAPNFHEHLKQQLGHTWDMACVESGRQIVEHFGVEK
jgi:hypothetical protein